MIKSPSDFLHFFDSDSDTRIVSLDDRFYRVPKFHIAENPQSVASIESNKELNAFFYKLVAEATRIVKIPIECFEQDWLTQLLARFCTRQEFFDVLNSDDSDSEKDDIKYRYLVDMMIQAMQSKDNATRAIRCLNIGDQALFTAGFFPERIVRKMGGEGVDYYLKMSQSHYGDAAVILREGSIKKIAARVGELRTVVRCIATATRHEDLRPFTQLMVDCGQAEPLISH